MAVRASATASPSSASASDGIAAIGQRCFQPGRSLGDGKSANRPGRTFQRMRQRPRLRRKRGQRVEQFGRLRREHRQHLVLEAGVAKRHATEMLEIDRTVIGCEWRRWHPVDPFEMKRHGIVQISPLYRSVRRGLVSQSRKWLTERMRDLPQICPVFAEESAPIAGFPKEFEDY